MVLISGFGSMRTWIIVLDEIIATYKNSICNVYCPKILVACKFENLLSSLEPPYSRLEYR
jgi:hypothetical protein